MTSEGQCFPTPRSKGSRTVNGTRKATAKAVWAEAALRKPAPHLFTLICVFQSFPQSIL